MSQLIVFVVDNPEKTDEVIDLWLSLGVPGATILNSTGLGRESVQQNLSEEDMPLIPTLSSLLRRREAPHSTIFVVVSDTYDVESLAAATQKITGKFEEPNTGILFTLPITKVWQTTAEKIKR